MGDGSEKDTMTSTEDADTTRELLGAILGRLDRLQEAQAVSRTLTDIQTNAMVERLAETAERSLTLIDRLSDPAVLAVVEKVRDVGAIVPALDRLATLVDSGGLDMLVELATAASALNRLMTDGLLERLVSQMEKIGEATNILLELPLDRMKTAILRMDEVGGLETMPDLVSGAVSLHRILSDPLVERVMSNVEQWLSAFAVLQSAATRNASESRSGSGIFGLVALMGDAENQKALLFGLDLIKALRSARS